MWEFTRPWLNGKEVFRWTPGGSSSARSQPAWGGRRDEESALDREFPSDFRNVVT